MAEVGYARKQDKMGLFINVTTVWVPTGAIWDYAGILLEIKVAFTWALAGTTMTQMTRPLHNSEADKHGIDHRMTGTRLSPINEAADMERFVLRRLGTKSRRQAA